MRACSRLGRVALRLMAVVLEAPFEPVPLLPFPALGWSAGLLLHACTPREGRISQSWYLIEAVFKEMKDRTTGSWWPLNHWTDSKVRVHGLYCSMAQLLRSVLWRRIRRAGQKISLRRLLAELDGIREVVNLYPMKGKTKHQPQQTVLTRLSRRQQRLVEILGLEREKHHELG